MGICVNATALVTVIGPLRRRPLQASIQWPGGIHTSRVAVGIVAGRHCSCSRALYCSS